MGELLTTFVGCAVERDVSSMTVKDTIKPVVASVYKAVFPDEDVNVAMVTPTNDGFLQFMLPGSNFTSPPAAIVTL